MSTKTLRKRIALVAVSALTAGVLSVASAPVANAAAADLVAIDAVGQIFVNEPAAAGLTAAIGQCAISSTARAADITTVNSTGTVLAGNQSVMLYLISSILVYFSNSPSPR